MASKFDITAEYARQFLNYDAEKGELIWKSRTPDMFDVPAPPQTKEGQCKRWNAMFAGTVAGCLRKGYIRVRLGGCRPQAHQIIWLMLYGEWPKDQLDHRDGKRDGNRPHNLRPATIAQNCQNRKMRKTNTSGYTGVSWAKKTQKWVVEIAVNGVRHRIGSFKDKEVARAAYLDAKKQYHTFQPVPREDA